MTRASFVVVLGSWLLGSMVLAVAGCGDDGHPPSPPGPDGGSCAGLSSCSLIGVTCDGDELVDCRRNAAGCLTETRVDCAATSQVCNDAMGPAACVDDPCVGVDVADRCDTAGLSCEGDTLVACGADAAGCLVKDATDCAETAGGMCDAAGATPVCVTPPDPCAAVLMADRCTAAGTSCMGETLVTCGPNAFGCLALTRTNCAARAGGMCAMGAPPACTFTGDPCAGITECTAASTRCDGPELVTCDRDDYGCLVERRVDCTAVTLGYCNTDATPLPMCETTAVDHCAGVTPCGPPGASCEGLGTLNVCAPDAFGCLRQTTTDCGAIDEMCGTLGGTSTCADLCAFVSDCAVAGATCDGDTLHVCAEDADGCLVDTATDCTTATAGEVCGMVIGGTAMCADACDFVTGCPTAGATCVGDTLHVCAEDADGCLVDTATDCAATTGSVCEIPTGGAAMCAAPPP